MAARRRCSCRRAVAGAAPWSRRRAATHTRASSAGGHLLESIHTRVSANPTTPTTVIHIITLSNRMPAGWNGPAASVCSFADMETQFGPTCGNKDTWMQGKSGERWRRKGVRLTKTAKARRFIPTASPAGSARHLQEWSRFAAERTTPPGDCEYTKSPAAPPDRRAMRQYRSVMKYRQADRTVLASLFGC